jgi:Cu+-exporting ATPase
MFNGDGNGNNNCRIMKKITLDIEGMHCASCANNISKSLNSVKGVQNANVNLLLKKAMASIDDSVSETDIQKAVSRVGNYSVRKISYENSMDNSEESPQDVNMNKRESEMPMKNHENMQMEEKGMSMENHEGHHGSADDSEIKSWKKKLIFAWIFTIPVAFLMISERIIPIEILPMEFLPYIMLGMAFPVVFIIGFSTIKGGFKGLARFYFNMDLLIALGTIIAYSTGILIFFLPIKDYSGVSAMIMAIFVTGKYIEAKARGKAGEEIKKLLELGAKNAIAIRDGKEIEIQISEIRLGDILVIKPGEKIPTDGIVVDGESAVDESMITGESIPSDKTKGSNVIGATVNQDGIIYIKATKIGKDTFLSHIIKLVQEAQGSKIPIQEFADRVTNVFVPAVLIITASTFIGWIYFSNNLALALAASISVLVIACPCALGLATPTALMVGSGMGAKNGILIRKGEAIQTMKEIKVIVFDKTGTITKGKPEVTEIYSSVGEPYLLEIAASLEKLSEHPLSKAVVSFANLKKYFKVSEFKILRGRGIEGRIGTKRILIGNSSLMKGRKISLKRFENKISEFEGKAYTTLIVSENEKIIGIIGVADTIKEDSPNIISELKKNDYRIIMITGDNYKTAKAIANEVGITEVIAEILPGEKAGIIKKLKEGDMVAFVGDGVNDAPALKESNVGIAMGTGTDIAIEAGDIILAKGSLTGVIQAINLSKATFSKIKQNLFWAFAYNTIAIPVAMAGFLHPIIAEIAMALSSITVVGNANLLRRKKI